jgi:hypothetical protein
MGSRNDYRFEILLCLPVEGGLPFWRIWVLLTGSGLAERLSRQTV